MTLNDIQTARRAKVSPNRVLLGLNARIGELEKRTAGMAGGVGGGANAAYVADQRLADRLRAVADILDAATQA